MIDLLISLGKILLALAPFLLLLRGFGKSNLKPEERYKQFLMPIAALVLCVVAMFLLNDVYDFAAAILTQIPYWIRQLADWLVYDIFYDNPQLGDAINNAANWLIDKINAMNLGFWAFYLANFILFLAYRIVKPILRLFMKGLFKGESGVFHAIAGLFYEHDEETDRWHIKENFGQARSFMKAFYWASIVLGVVAAMVSGQLYLHQLLNAPFYPVFSVIIVGEAYFFLNGLTKKELHHVLTGETDEAESFRDYSIMRKVLRKLFPDKLNAENTSVCDSDSGSLTSDDALTALESSEDVGIETYGKFMRRKSDDGLRLDYNYLMSGKNLLQGQSVLFNNPFYYDLIPYIFYPMNRTMLRHKKVLIILGRHGTEAAMETWCRDGLTAVTNVPSMWNIGVLTDQPQELDVGIISRSAVHDLALHEANREFFDETEFVVLIEPSRLLTTAQVGLNSLVRHCRRKEKQLVFCSTDKNCDGLLDALSHVLMTSIQEVSATGHHEGASSYMCWDGDSEHLQHRMLPNISRYLGMGTELSFAALKNQVPQTQWFGGDAFPVTDLHWIVRQYYYDLLHYANLPTSQETIDHAFRVSADLWSAPKRPVQYMTVEDESYNMFEIKRDFATRATEQGFINVISSDYLLKDYMASNDSIFNADPKAIPYITADYARTNRNVALRLCLRLSTGQVPEHEIRRELLLIDKDLTDPAQSLWHEICTTCGHAGEPARDRDGREILVCHTPGGDVTFTSEVLECKRKFSMDSGVMENMYRITDSRFIRLVLGALQSAEYIAEDENGQQQYLGTELQGHVFQKYLPGEFFTFGGKYYEMLRVTADGRVLVRRAADHIHGRPFYRQERQYTLSNPVDSTVMGECRDLGAMRITRQFADIRVQTPAYWSMDRYNDFATARRIQINGIPDRVYNNKAILRIDIAPEGGLDSKVLPTLAVLVNEVLRTLLAENQDYLAVVSGGEISPPTTYSLQGENGFTPDPCSLYIIEDSLLDIGLLDAVERNLNRIFSIICDYLQWHEEEMKSSQETPQGGTGGQGEPGDSGDAGEEGSEKKKKKKGIIARIFGGIAGFFKKIFKAIADFFRKLFGRKKKQPDPDAPAQTPDTPGEAAEPAETPDVPASETPDAPDAEPGTQEPAPAEGKVKKPGFWQRLREKFRRKKKAPEEAAEGPAIEESSGEGESLVVEEAPGDGETLVVEEAPGEGGDEGGSGDEGGEALGSVMLFSAAPAGGESVHADDAATDDVLEYEPEQVTKAGGPAFQRLPYHERYYLRYGGSDKATWLALSETCQLLVALGYGNSALTQARKGKDVAAMVERDFVPNREGVHYCDFCGCELTGLEYDILGDGRERCTSCARTAIKSLEEFTAMHDAVLRNMRVFFGIRINASVHVQMVNSKKLHKKLGKTFVPTGKPDGRVLGVAIKDRNGYSILIENGAPKMQATMTMVHEMTHIWQYLNWDARQIKKTYGRELDLQVYEGMAKWVEIQYAYLLGEVATAKREELITRHRQDEYGFGFLKYVEKYPLSTGSLNGQPTPFDNPQKPL